MKLVIQDGDQDGTYKAQVQLHCVNTDKVELVYTSEPICGSPV